MKSISVKKAVLINFISRYSTIFITLILNSVLARLLTPNDYGIVTVINVFIGFFITLADIGIGPAIIQNKALDEDDISNIFIFTLGISIITSIFFIVFSYILAWFYEEKIYILLGKILSISIFFNIINMVPNALLLKEKNFKVVAIRNIIITILGGFISIVLAIIGAKYYALAINSVFISLITFIVNFYTCKMKIKYNFNKNSLLKIKDFATYQFAFNFVNYFSRNLDNLLIGKVLGNISLGYYDKAYKLMLYPVQNITHVITPVLHPILSDYQQDYEEIYIKYIKIVKILALIGIFFCIFCFVAAEEIVTIMFGKQWIDSVLAFKILSISILPQMITGSSGSIFQSLGETKFLFKTSMINTIITITFIFIGIICGNIESVALGVTISYWIHFIVVFYILIKQVLKKDIVVFFKQFYSIIVIFIIMIAVFLLIKIKHSNILLSIVMKLIICIVGYTVGMIFTKEYKLLINK